MPADAPSAIQPFWGVVRSQAHREAYARDRCIDNGFETFLPLVQKRTSGVPLFSGYFFIRIVEQWRKINSTFGVLCLVRVGDCPCHMPDAEIAALKSMVVGGFVRLPEAPSKPARRVIAVGSRVKITSGAFGGWVGLYQGQSTRDRERVLLNNLFGDQREVKIASGLIVPV